MSEGNFPGERETWAPHIDCGVREFMKMLVSWESGETPRPDSMFVAIRNHQDTTRVSQVEEVVEDHGPMTTNKIATTLNLHRSVVLTACMRSERLYSERNGRESTWVLK